jgi:hypothetical protein
MDVGIVVSWKDRLKEPATKLPVHGMHKLAVSRLPPEGSVLLCVMVNNEVVRGSNQGFSLEVFRTIRIDKLLTYSMEQSPS